MALARPGWTGDMSIPLQFTSFYDGQGVFVWSDCLLDLGTYFLVSKVVFVKRCVVFCGNTSFPWLVFFFAALLWGSMIHKHTGGWMWQGSASTVSWNWEKCSCQSKLVSTWSKLLSSVLFWRVSLCLEPSSDTTEPRYLNLVTDSSFRPFTLIFL